MFSFLVATLFYWCDTAPLNGKCMEVTYTDIGEFLKGTLVGVVGDYVLYNVIQSFSTTTPEWSPYGWGLFVAFNGAILFWLKHALTK